MNESWKNPKIILFLIGMVLIAGVITISILRDRIVNQQMWQVSVTGEGKVSYQPDIANVSLGVLVEKASTAQSALSQLNNKMDKVIAALNAIGISSDDIQTQGYSVYSQYDYINGISVMSGYNATQQLLVKVTDLTKDSDQVAKVITQATQAGANQINGVTFEVANLEELKQQARLKAIADAKSKAETLADAAGVRLKRVVGWWDNVISVPGPIPYYLDGKGGGGSVSSSGSVPSGLNEIIVDVGVNYQIK